MTLRSYSLTNPVPSTLPLESSLPYSNHRLRVWIVGQNGIHMRLYKSDEFRLGGSLDFERLVRGPRQVAFATQAPHSPATAHYTPLLPYSIIKYMHPYVVLHVSIYCMLIYCILL